MIEKFCVNCVHAVTQSPIMYCSKSTYMDLVTGDVRNMPCYHARDSEKYCGQRAINFEPKGEPNEKEDNT